MPYSWEAVDIVSANYTPDITPLILAAHKNNYEILKILLDRGASLPTPHDLKCSCEACITGMLLWHFSDSASNSWWLENIQIFMENLLCEWSNS